MLKGFDHAVGPVQVSEKPEMLRYACSVGAGLHGVSAEPELCMFRLFDGGPGKTYYECAIHNVAALAIDAEDSASARAQRHMMEQFPEDGKGKKDGRDSKAHKR